MYMYMHVYMYVHIYIYIYIHIFIRTYTYACTHEYIYIHVYKYICIYICVSYIYIYTHICMCKYTYKYTYMHIYIYCRTLNCHCQLYKVVCRGYLCAKTVFAVQSISLLFSVPVFLAGFASQGTKKTVGDLKKSEYGVLGLQVYEKFSLFFLSPHPPSPPLTGYPDNDYLCSSLAGVIRYGYAMVLNILALHCNTLRHTATHCNARRSICINIKTAHGTRNCGVRHCMRFACAEREETRERETETRLSGVEGVERESESESEKATRKDIVHALERERNETEKEQETRASERQNSERGSERARRKNKKRKAEQKGGQISRETGRCKKRQNERKTERNRGKSTLQERKGNRETIRRLRERKGEREEERERAREKEFACARERGRGSEGEREQKSEQLSIATQRERESLCVKERTTTFVSFFLELWQPNLMFFLFFFLVFLDGENPASSLSTQKTFTVRWRVLIFVDQIASKNSLQCLEAGLHPRSNQSQYANLPNFQGIFVVPKIPLDSEYSREHSMDSLK